MSMELAIEKERRYTVEEYLEIETKFPQEKFEYRDGYIVNLRELLAMAGGSVNHALIAANAGRALGNRLQGTPCRVYSSDLRVRIPRKVLYAYPDLTIVCGKPEIETHRSGGQTILNPRVMVEVLSPSTEAYDRGDKFARFREIESFEELLMVSQSEPRVESYYRGKDGWSMMSYSGVEAVARLRSLDVDLPLNEVYAGVDFTVNETKTA